MSSGVFRGKESSNRIKLSRLVQDLLNFGVLGSLQLWGWGARWWGVVGGVPPTHVHTHTHMHINMLNMIISIANGSPHWGNPREFRMMSYVHVHACVCMHVHVCGGHPLTTPTPIQIPPHPPVGGTPESVKIQKHLN